MVLARLFDAVDLDEIDSDAHDHVPPRFETNSNFEIPNPNPDKPEPKIYHEVSKPRRNSKAISRKKAQKAQRNSSFFCVSCAFLRQKFFPSCVEFDL